MIFLPSVKKVVVGDINLRVFNKCYKLSDLFGDVRLKFLGVQKVPI